MPKSLKPKDDNYIDTSGIIHYRGILKDVLGGLDTRITGNTNNISDLQQRVVQYISSREMPTKDGFNSIVIPYDSSNPIMLDGSEYGYDNTRVEGFSIMSDAGQVGFQIAVITYSNNSAWIGKVIYRHIHGGFGHRRNWKSIT